MTYKKRLALLSWLALSLAAQTLAAQAQVPPSDAPPAFTINTPLKQIAADPAAAAVMNQDVPGLLTDKAYDEIKGMSLKEIARLSSGQITDEMVEKTQSDLSALGPVKPPQ